MFPERYLDMLSVNKTKNMFYMKHVAVQRGFKI